MFKHTSHLVLVIGVIILSGCATSEELIKKVAKKAEPAERTQFLGDKPMRMREDIPFHSAWVKTGFNKYEYNKVYIAPVDLSHLKEMSWWDELEGELTDKDMQEKVEKIAEYTRNVFKQAFLDNPQQSFELVDKPDEKTLIVEIALIEAIPNKAGFEAITKGLGMLHPAASLAGTLARSKGSKSSTAFEARIRDGATAEVVAQFADREQEKVGYINVKDFQWYSHIESIIEEWADQFVQIANRAPDDIIADSPTFYLKPW